MAVCICLHERNGIAVVHLVTKITICVKDCLIGAAGAATNFHDMERSEEKQKPTT